MNKRIGTMLVIVGTLVVAAFIATIAVYKITPNSNPPDFVGQDDGSP